MNQPEAEQNSAKAAEVWAHLQQIQYVQGGFINAVNAETVGAVSVKVQGAEKD